MTCSCLNYERASEAIELLNGVHNFASFATKQTDEDDTIRDLKASINLQDIISINRDNNKFGDQVSLYNLHFKSRSFLYNQVSLHTYIKLLL